MVQVTPVCWDTHPYGPVVVDEPYGRTGVPLAGLPSGHCPPLQVETVPFWSMVASCGGEKVAHRTGGDPDGSRLQAMFALGERKAPGGRATAFEAATRTVVVATTCSLWQLGGGPSAPISSRNV